jgi:hypothetical protein
MRRHSGARAYDRAVALHLIPGTPAPDTPAERTRARVKAAPRPAELLQCPRCGGREVLGTVTGATIKAGRVSGGTKAWVCAGCHRKGERVVLA